MLIYDTNLSHQFFTVFGVGEGDAPAEACGLASARVAGAVGRGLGARRKWPSLPCLIACYRAATRP